MIKQEEKDKEDYSNKHDNIWLNTLIYDKR